MASRSVAIADVRLAWPAGGSTWAALTSSPVAAGSTVPVAVKTTVAPTGTVTGVLMSPLPDGRARAAPGAGTGPRHAGQRRRERVGDRGTTRVARPERVGDGDGVGRRPAGDHAVDPVGLRDVEIRHRRPDRRVGGRAVVARCRVRRRTRHRRRVGDRIGRRVAGRDREGRRDGASGGAGQRAEIAREGRRAIPGVRNERQAGGRRVGKRDADGIRWSRVDDGDRVDDVGPGHSVEGALLGDVEIGGGRQRHRTGRRVVGRYPHRRRRPAP